MKTCSKCGSSEHKFEKNRTVCMNCRNCQKRDYNKIYGAKNKDKIVSQKRMINRTKIGRIQYIYNAQIKASKKRGHELPKYTKKEFTEWCINQGAFHEIYSRWVEGEYEKYLSPSIDRIDNSKGYEFGNIQIVTWKKNFELSLRDKKNGTLSTGSKLKGIKQYTLDGVFMNEYVSLREVARAMGVDCRKEVDKCCKGILNSCKGYTWKYNQDTRITNKL